jgi:hypothetical protein
MLVGGSQVIGFLVVFPGYIFLHVRRGALVPSRHLWVPLMLKPYNLSHLTAMLQELSLSLPQISSFFFFFFFSSFSLSTLKIGYEKETIHLKTFGFTFFFGSLENKMSRNWDFLCSLSNCNLGAWLGS